MNSSTSIDEDVLSRLNRMARVAAIKFDGLEQEDFLSEAWLAYKQAKDAGKPDSAAFTRAEYAIIDAMENWITVPKHHMLVDGEDVRELVYAIPQHNRKTLRTKLPRNVKRSLRSLSKRDRRILYLSYMWNRTASEIANDIGVSETVVYNVKHRSLQKIQKQLGVFEKPTNTRTGRLKTDPYANGGKPMKNTYHLLAPDGSTFTVTKNFKAFCEAHALSYKAMREVVNPNAPQKTHKGWTRLTITSQ